MMIKRRLLMSTLLISLWYSPLSAEAQTVNTTTCDNCTQLSQLNAAVATVNNSLQKLLELMTTVLFGGIYDFGNTMAAFTAIPPVQNNAYSDQQSLLHAVEVTYQGSTGKDETLKNNYSAIFNNYLLTNSGTFDSKNASISSLYVNPSSPGFYTEDQRLAAQRYIMLASGAAMSTARKPAKDWLSTSSEKDQNALRTQVSTYYTYSAMQSAMADNLAYIYGLNTGQPIDGSLDNYSTTMISESGVITYILSQKAESEDWYNQLKDMGILSLLKEQTILLGGAFLMLTRIEEDLRRILVTNSIEASVIILAAQSLANASNQTPQTPSISIS